MACKPYPQHKNKENFNRTYEQGIINYYTYRDSVTYYLEKLQQQLPPSPSEESQARLLYLKGLYFAELEESDSSIHYYEQAYAMVKNQNTLKATILTSLVASASNSHNAAALKKYLTLLEQCVSKMESPMFEGRLLSIHGTLSARKGDTQQAIRYYQQSDSILNISDNAIFRPHQLYALAKNYSLQSEYDLAFEYYHSAIALCKELHIMHQLPLCYMGLSRLYRKQHRYDEALDLMKECKTLALNKRQLAQVYECYAIIYAEQKSWEKAEDYMLLSLKLRIEQNKPAAIAVAYNNLGTFYRRKGDLPLSEKYYKKALAIRYENNLSDTGMLRNLNNLADVYIKNDKVTEAINLYLNAIAFTGTFTNYRLSAHAQLKLAETYKEQGKLNKAMNHYSEYVKQDIKLNQEEAENHLNELMVEYDSEHQKEVITLQQKQVSNRNRILFLLSFVVVLLSTSATLRILWYQDKNKALEKSFLQQQQINSQQMEIEDLRCKLDNCCESNDQNPLMHDLSHLFNHKQVFTDPSLSLEKLARLLNTNTSYVSHAINSGYECNFKTLVSKFRIDYCKQQLINDAMQERALKEIASDAGFVSLSTFYTAFKKELGITPAQFRENIVGSPK